MSYPPLIDGPKDNGRRKTDVSLGITRISYKEMLEVAETRKWIEYWEPQLVVGIIRIILFH